MYFTPSANRRLEYLKNIFPILILFLLNSFNKNYIINFGIWCLLGKSLIIEKFKILAVCFQCAENKRFFHFSCVIFLKCVVFFPTFFQMSSYPPSKFSILRISPNMLKICIKSSTWEDPCNKFLAVDSACP